MKPLLYKCSFTLIATLTVFVGFSQTGPSGAGSSTNNVIWLDAHALGLANGASLTTFTDFSGNSNDFTQASSVKRPTVNTGVLNGMSVVTFDGFDDALNSGSFSGLETNNLTYFIVFKKASLTSQTLITSSFASNSTKWRSYSNSGNDKLIAAHYAPSIKHVNYVDPNTPTFITYEATPSAHRLYKQGVLQMTKNEGFTTPTGLLNITLGNLDNNPLTSHYALNGYLAEVIVYNSSLNSLEKVLIENYLGAKYGMAIPTDLYSHQATHPLELIAIGDDGADSQSTAKGKGVVQFSLPTAMSANEYLLAAHTDVALSDFNTIDLPAALVTSGHQRWNRTWRVDETGDVGTTTITFELTGINDFGSSTSYRLLVDSDGVFTDATVITGVYTPGNVTFTHDFTDGDFFTLAGIEDIQEIHSQIDGNWSSPLTWDCACIPGSNDDVYIDPLTSVTLDVDGSAKYLEISTNGKLIINSDFTLSLFGELEIPGTLEMTDGTISLDGTNPQYIELNGQTVDFNNISINNTSGSNIDLFGGTYILNGVLSPNSGTTAIDGATTFIVNSTSATTGGRIGQIFTPASVTGNISVRRFVQGGNADWRDLCSPVIGADFTAWDPDIFISGPGFPDGCAFGNGECFKSIVYYTSNTENKVSNVTDPILNGRGFEIFLGDDLNTFSTTTLTTTGTLNNGNDIVNLMSGGGWYTIGNPYACPITYNSIEKTSQIGKYYYVYDPTTGGYQWYDQSSSSSSVPSITADGLIPIGQAVWVNLSSTGTMTIKQTDKSLNTGTFIKAPTQSPEMMLTLSEDNSTYSCTIAIQEELSVTDGHDSLIDILHLSTGLEKSPSLCIAANDQLIRKNYILDDRKEKAFNLETSFLNDGYYSFSASNISSFDHYKEVMIYDKQEDEFYDLKQSDEFTFYANKGVYNRFHLVLGNGEAVASNVLSTDETGNTDLEITQMGNYMVVNNPGDELRNSEIKLINLLGQEIIYSSIMNLDNGNTTISLPSGLNGVYLFSIIHSNGNRITKKLVF